MRHDYTQLITAMGQVANECNRWLDNLLPYPDPAVDVFAAMRHGVMNGGKRIRPFLMVETAQIFNPNPQNTQKMYVLAGVLEMIHCYSLIHDDLPAMDNDDTRRGQPTVHKKYNEATAILAGDGLLTWAFYMLAKHELHEYCFELAKNAFRMVDGQARDMVADKSDWDSNSILEMQSLKTGALLSFACHAGAKLGGAQPWDSDQMQEFGQLFGALFQISDDWLDHFGDSTKMGKRAQKDNEQNKISIIKLLGRQGAQQKITQLRTQCESILQPYQPRAQNLLLLCDYLFDREK